MSAIAFAAQLACIDVYDPITPNVFDKLYRIGESVCGTKLVGNRLHVAMQGTENVAGWLADADIEPVEHPVLGHLHAGFWRNIPALLEQLQPDIDELKQQMPNLEIEIEGHSKGAGEGTQLAGALHASGYPVVQLYLFACPNAGFQDFANYVQANISALSYRNAPAAHPEFGDPVPLVPTSPYVRPYPHVALDVPPAGFERMIDLEWHRAKLYLQGVHGE